MSINELSTFTIRGTVKAYKQLCPNSTVSEGSIRKSGCKWRTNAYKKSR